MAVRVEARHIDFMTPFTLSALVLAVIVAVLLGEIMHVEMHVARQTIRMEALAGAAFLFAAFAVGYLARRRK